MPKSPPSHALGDKPACLVLGGSGFIGSRLVAALAAAGHPVRSFDRGDARLDFVTAGREHVSAIKGDFQNAGELAEAAEGCEICFHLVSTTLPKSSNDDPVFDVESNVVGSLRLLEICRSKGVRKIIYVSSGGTVYGVPRRVPIDETHPTEPVCSYGIAKLAIEKYLHLHYLLHGLEYCVLRVSNPYGPGQNIHAPQGAVGVFLGKLIDDAPIHIWGDGEVVRDYIYIDDVVGALLAAMKTAAPPVVLNIGSGAGLSLNALLAEIAAATGRTPRVIYEDARLFDVPVSVLDIGKAREKLDWRPGISMGEGLRRTWDWLLTKQGRTPS